MNKYYLYFAGFIFSLALFSCGGNGSEGDNGEEGDPNELVKVEGGKYRGGILHLNSIEDYSTLFPPAANDVYSTHIAGQSYEGLFKLNQKTLEAEPCLAESFEIDNSRTKYIYKIRQGVTFHDDDCFPEGKGREVKASDFKYCLDFLCSNHENNKWPNLFRNRVVGANEYFDGKANEVVGIKVNGDYELEINLINPYSGMNNLLAMLVTAVYPKEAIDKYGYDGMNNHMVGTGSFIPEKLENGSEVILKRNSKYWAKDEFGNQLPFLAKVNISFIKDKGAALDAFKNEELDMVWGIPVEEIPNIMGTLEEAKEGKNRDMEVQTVNSLNIQYYGFLYTSEVFNNINVRKAFNHAIDRDSLIEFVLEGEGVSANGGFVPPMNGYPSETIKGFDYNPSKAKTLMAQAGYPNGKGFPEVTLHMNSSGGTNKKIADFISEMLFNNIGVKVKIEVEDMSSLFPKVETGNVDFWRFGWIADYPDPSNFLDLFYGGNYAEVGESSINFFRYKNPEFDKLYEAALKETDTKTRMEMYAKCDQMIIDDAVVMPIMFNIDIRLINPLVKDFFINEMEYRDLTKVYFMKENKSNVRVYDNLVEGEEAE